MCKNTSELQKSSVTIKYLYPALDRFITSSVFLKEWNLQQGNTIYWFLEVYSWRHNFCHTSLRLHIVFSTSLEFIYDSDGQSRFAKCIWNTSN